ncbi:hypothetical protein ACK3BE_09545 [Pseudomonas mandelii]|uniref:hypothetical protein n=1 Tax=Pseudomonas mandelii TaxID=75612 RepID=UPI00398D41C3
MAIIPNTDRLHTYPYSALSSEVVEILSSVVIDISGPVEVTLKILDCYCHILGVMVGVRELRSERFDLIVRGFLGALKDEDLISSNIFSRRRHARRVLMMLECLKVKFPGITTYSWDVTLLDRNNDLWQQKKSKLCKSKILYWNGWPIVSRKNKVSYLDFSGIWHSHGEKFTGEVYELLKADGLKRAKPPTTAMNYYAGFLSSNPDKWTAEIFKNSDSILDFFEGFMIDFFSTAQIEERSLASAGKTWRDMITVVEEVFIRPGVWAEPDDCELPKPLISGNSSNMKNVVTKKDGRVVNNKLMIEVPIEITDDEAISILFKQIGESVDVVKKWATCQARALRKAQLQRLYVARTGKPLGIKKSRNGRSPSIDTLGVANICATFESEGFNSDGRTAEHSYGNNLKEVAKLLGLPINQSLFPFQCLLVIENAKITGSFLDGFQLYDKRNKRSGFMKTDLGYELVGYKDRRGKKLSEQKIPLSPRAASLVRQVEKITQPLREFLKKKGDPKWRELFLTCGEGFGYPITADTSPWTSNLLVEGNPLTERLTAEFKKHTKLSGSKLIELIKNVTLSKLRATCGVSVYLKTRSVKEMANALGHKKYDGELLGSYLPDAILMFFQTRWIRIFQRAIVCEAMKGSDYFMQVVGFKTVAEVDEFLMNHALKKMPSGLVDPEGVDNVKKDDGELYISLDVGILTALSSIELAVKKSVRKSEINSKAMYWARFSNLLSMQINSSHNAMHKDYLKDAQKNAMASKFEGIIYAAA